MDWNDVRYFLGLARLGAVRAAGAALGVSHSTVARRIEGLESELGVRLFDRHRDGYSLTEAGRQMLPGAERVEREMAAIERGLVGRDERLAGPVAITMCDSFVSALLMPALRDFCVAHEDIELTVTNDSRPFDLSRREADVAVRLLALDSQPPEYLIGTRVAPLVICNYVAVEHADALDPARPGARPRFLSYDDRRITETVLAASSYADVPLWGAFASMELVSQAALEGLGLVVLPTYAGDVEPRLRRLANPDLRHAADVWVLTHPDLRDNARIRAARRCVVTALRGLEPVFRGASRCGDGTERPEFTPPPFRPGRVVSPSSQAPEPT